MALQFFFTRYTQFTGRSPRSEYLWPLLFFVATALALTTLGLFLGIIVPCIAVAVRRLHYASLPGWFYPAIFLPYVGHVALIGIGLLPPKLEGARLGR